MLTLQVTKVLEFKIQPIALPDKHVFRYTALVELTAEEFDKVMQQLKANVPTTA